MNIKLILSTLPNQPGIYQMIGERDQVIYVGKARDLKKRVSSYFSKTAKDPKTTALVKHIKNIEIIATRTENEALILEANLIKKFKPHYNILFRDDKSYPYIFISTDHEYPAIDFYRGTPKSKGRYFGPYPDGTAVRETIHLIQKLFHLRTCTDSFYSNRSRPCLLHQIGRCDAPCVGLIDKEKYQENVRHTILFLEGKSDQLIKELEKQMETASTQLNYEYAARVRDQITHLHTIQERQYVSTTEGDIDVIGLTKQAGLVCLRLMFIRHGVMLGGRSYFPKMPDMASEEEILSAFLAQHYLNLKDMPKEIIIPKNISDSRSLMQILKITISTAQRGARKRWLEMATNNAQHELTLRLLKKSNLDERFNALYAFLDLKEKNSRIECFDISHTMGEETVGSCVVFNRTGPVKSDYRRFNIKGITPGSDTGAMDQVLRRHYQRLLNEPEKIPDILLVDGGKTQLHAVEKVLKELTISNIHLMGVAKGVTRKAGYETLYQVDLPPIHLPQDSHALHLIQQIRDEAHRFAITGHRLRRDKKRKTSFLEMIPGIGPKRRRELLRHFGGIQELSRASLEEIAKVPGINQSLAKKILEALQNMRVGNA